MVETALLRQLQGFSLTTAEILYRLPDYPRLLQSYIWQDFRSVEDVFRAWQQFLDARPLRQVVEYQTRCAQNAYEAYITEFSRLGDLCISLTRRASEPLRQVSRRS